MSIAPDDFVARLVERCPEVRPIVDEHFADNGELLLHPLVADVRRFAIDRFDAHDEAVVERCLSVLSDGLQEGDERVQNAVAVSFVEDTGWWDSDMAAFIVSWPAPLKAEAERQRAWRP